MKREKNIFSSLFGAGIRQWRGETDFRERKSNFSLDFLAIGSSNPGEPRDKIAPHDKSYAWIPIFLEFLELRKVGVFSYLFYSLAKGHING